VIFTHAERFSRKQIQPVSRFSFSDLSQEKILRGALTNGREWIFLLVKLDYDYDRSSSKQSSVVRLETMRSLSSGELENTQPWPDLIAAILSHWVS
jgi:hypothetical protein